MTPRKGIATTLAICMLPGMAAAQVFQFGQPDAAPQPPQFQTPSLPAEGVQPMTMPEGEGTPAPATATPTLPSASVTPAETAPAITPAVPAPPPNQLGQQINTPVPLIMPITGAGEAPSVLYPTTDAIVERAVRQIEDMQLTPNQYERLKSIFLERHQQRALPYNTPPKPITRTLLVNLDPGVTPPTLRLSRGQQTSIVFSDVSGQPWFIEKVSLNRQLSAMADPPCQRLPHPRPKVRAALGGQSRPPMC